MSVVMASRDVEAADAAGGAAEQEQGASHAATGTARRARPDALAPSLSVTILPGVAPGEQGDESEARRRRAQCAEDLAYEARTIVLLVALTVLATPIFIADVYLCERVVIPTYKPQQDVTAGLLGTFGVWTSLSWAALHQFATGKWGLFVLALAVLGVLPFAGALLYSAWLSPLLDNVFWFLPAAFAAYWFTFVAVRWCQTSRWSGRALAPPSPSPSALALLSGALLMTTLTVLTAAWGCVWTGLPLVVIDPTLQVALFGVVQPLATAVFVQVAVLPAAAPVAVACGYDGEQVQRFTLLFAMTGKLAVSLQSFIALFQIGTDAAFIVSMASEALLESAPWLLGVHFAQREIARQPKEKRRFSSPDQLLLYAAGLRVERQALALSVFATELAQALSLLLGAVVAFLVTEPYGPEQLLMRMVIGVALGALGSAAKSQYARRSGIDIGLVNASLSLRLALGMFAVIYAQGTYYLTWSAFWLFDKPQAIAHLANSTIGGLFNVTNN
jgi:hypothetical protein